MKFGLIGHPIAHSLSPALFRAGYDGRFPYDLIETPDFEQAYERFLREYDGINVTAPFKELALAKADLVTPECRLVGATNLLRKTPEGITAYNSDYRGLCQWLAGVVARLSPPLQQRTAKVLIVGMGGAGKAAAAAAWTMGCSLTLMNRHIEKAEEMASQLVGEGREDIEVRPMEDFMACFQEADIIIYNLPVRLPVLDAIARGGAADDGMARQFRTRHLLEANYKDPSFDKDLLKIMESRYPGLQYAEGRTWLLLQALTGYELFTGEKPDFSKMSAQI